MAKAPEKAPQKSVAPPPADTDAQPGVQSKFRQYEKELSKLVDRGNQLMWAMQYNCDPEAFKVQVTTAFKKDTKKVDAFIKALPPFNSAYQAWYSEAQALIKQMLPNRLSDFVRLYEKPKTRKSVEYGNYVMEDYLQGLRVTFGGDIRVDRTAAIPQLEQQIDIVKAIEQRFKSSLFDIRQLVQADLFDSEVDVARELLKNGYARAAGAVAGVVLESHLAQVAENHNLKASKANPTIGDWNDLLKADNVVETEQWRRIQHLADLRNLCDHKKTKEPTSENVEDLISGVERVTKTLF